MISCAALHKLARAWADLRQEPPVLVLCPDCEAVLRHALDGMFVAAQEPHGVLLSRAQVMGFTFEHGLPDQCALHPFFREDALCLPLK